MTYIMTEVQQKKITDVIKQEGLALKDFSFVPVTNDSFNLIYKLNTQFKFKYSRGINGQSIYHMCPGPEGKLNHVVQPHKFPDALKELKNWIIYLKENIEIGNPWEEMVEFKNQLFDDYFDSYQEYLNTEEVTRFNKTLDLLFKEISILNGELSTLNDNVMSNKIPLDVIQKDIQHLKDQGSKVSKKDLWLLFLGTIVNWGITADSLNKVFQFSEKLWSIIRFPKLL